MKVYFLNTLGIGIDIIQLVAKKTKISGVIGLSKRDPGEAISDYVYQKEFCKTHNLKFVELKTYNFSNDTDKSKLLDFEIDVLVVSGWQRLVPDWLINHCKICIIGIHGSPLGITKGRGRSPQNWALILGLKEFYISIFKIDSGIDSGQIIATKKFIYSEFDDIKTSYYKTCLLTTQMISEVIQHPDRLHGDFEEQDEAEAEYFPKRRPEDSFIDWNLSSSKIVKFVKGLTKPYPGARTTLNEKTIKIWKAIPFEIDFETEAIPGQVVKKFSKGDVLVKTTDSFVLIEQMENKQGVTIEEGDIFESRSFEYQIKDIIKNHKDKFPGLKITSMISGL